MSDDFFSDLRRTYKTSKFLDEKDFEEDPYKEFKKWFEQAQKQEVGEANAFILSTSSTEKRVSSRVVLLKSLEDNCFTFFTNYTSKKVNDIEQNSQVSAVFYWQSLNKQVRIEGEAHKISRQKSEKYFQTRPYESQLGALVSKQSKIISSREDLEKKYKELREKYKKGDVPCPSFWGGIKINANYFEFWQGQANRLHDRIAYTKVSKKEWKRDRLSP